MSFEKPLNANQPIEEQTGSLFNDVKGVMSKFAQMAAFVATLSAVAPQTTEAAGSAKEPVTIGEVVTFQNKIKASASDFELTAYREALGYASNGPTLNSDELVSTGVADPDFIQNASVLQFRTDQSWGNLKVATVLDSTGRPSESERVLGNAFPVHYEGRHYIVTNEHIAALMRSQHAIHSDSPSDLAVFNVEDVVTDQTLTNQVKERSSKWSDRYIDNDIHGELVYVTSLHNGLGEEEGGDSTVFAMGGVAMKVSAKFIETFLHDAHSISSEAKKEFAQKMERSYVMLLDSKDDTRFASDYVGLSGSPLYMQSREGAQGVVWAVSQLRNGPLLAFFYGPDVLGEMMQNAKTVTERK